ncbi:MAG: 2OG-Fe(II) oxygenase family protein [Acidimicrobiia bacterium]|nr:2OG-Fe(II) oxygenase family protein [Acidimicrobiia bacterium]
MLDPPIVETTPLNSQVQAIDAVEGRMVIFRSWLRHSVLPSTIDEDRVTISFNVTM